MKTNVSYRLYLVTDRDMLKRKDLSAAVKEAIKGGVTVVQLREKNLSSLEFYNTAVQVKEITDKYNVPLIINDRLDIALAVDAAGLHVGQKDIPAGIARRLLGSDKLLGVSAATLEEALKAENEGADYIGVGAIFPTSTKDDARAVSIQLLRNIKESLSIPVVAIGGINSSNVKLLEPACIDGIAVVSDILGKENITLAAKTLSDIFVTSTP
jgi:thiamine-phosphate pyrophosphorylase